MNTISITTTQNIDIEFYLASVGDRILGRIIDWLVLAGYVILLLAVIGFGNIEGFFSGFPWVVILFALPVVFYDLLCEIFFNGQSAGKKAMGIKVINLAGDQPSLGQYLLRWAFRLVDFSLSSGLVAVIMVAASDKKQRLGDLVAGTVLVKTKPRTTLTDTWYQPTAETTYMVTYPEVIQLKDSDIQLVKEVMNTARQTGNLQLLWQAQQKIEMVLRIQSRQTDARDFLATIIADFNHVTAQL